jgi:hypothetical protein
LALKKSKKIHNYRISIVFKYDIVVGFTLVLVLDGNRAITSFFSLCNVVVGNALMVVLEGNLVGVSSPIGTIKMMQLMF